MASWQDELDVLLGQLGVQHEQPRQEPGDTGAARQDEQVADLTLIQYSSQHQGVTYRLDLDGPSPHLRVYLPAETGACKQRVYLVELPPQSFLGHLFALYLTASSGGSEDFLAVEGAITYHLFYAVGEAMKVLFWRGDLEAMRWPPEIVVSRLL